jgi:hypothetical protein
VKQAFPAALQAEAAEPGRIPGASGSWTAWKILGARIVQIAASRPVSPVHFAIRLLAMTWALVLVHASAARSSEPLQEEFPTGPSDRVATAVQPAPSSPLAQSETPSNLLPHKRLSPFSKTAHTNDPYDDAASDDPNDDDDSWEDPTADDDTEDTFSILWLRDVLRYQTQFEAGYASPQSQLTSSPFPSLKRLRC